MADERTPIPGPLRDLIGYGEHVPRVTWPGGAHIAVSLVVNYEEGSEPSFAAGDGRNEHHGGEEEYPYPSGVRDLAQESVFEYGSRVGIWRLLRLLDQYGVKATLFACAMAFEENPAVARAARNAGHNLVSHGWRWVEHWTLSREEELEHIRRAANSFKQTWGERPQGWYCRYGPSVNTRELISAEGFLYDCDAYNDDLPYFTLVGTDRHLVIPYSLTYNDLQGDRSPQMFLDYCVRGFDELWNEGRSGSPKMMSIGLHPRMVGQAARISALREFIEHAQSKGQVWFAGRDDIAQWWIDNHDSFTSVVRDEGVDSHPSRE
jgi:peptidoglycan/xylan/chitin deacetylase (PgdA/CDA1 family)